MATSLKAEARDAEPTAASWVRNAWYVACMPHEIEGKPLGRTICNEQMVFFRGIEGQVAALEDFCPHRGAPLSLGFLRDGALVCGYHGLTMGCRGKTEGMPGQRVGGFPPIRSFPVIERYGFIWVWPGDPDLADPAKLRHLAWAEDEGWAYGGGIYHVASDYRLMIDNLMDLTHETYVHATSIGQKEIDEAPVRTRLVGSEVVTSRFMDNVSPPPFWAMALDGAGLPSEVPVDRWQICHFHLPSSVEIEVGVAPMGQGGYDAPMDQKVYAMVVDMMTPETDSSHWYFWGMARRFAVNDQDLTDSIRDGQGRIFAEDIEMLERQQQNLSRQPDRRLLLLNIDAGGVRSRQLIDKAIAVELA
ncbi:aromatic ring-hydroxylating oxygenase subunit alpha [Sphingobium algorifonticola]|uniref:Aromatic ring-hydroxylating dioxygenase subunit alpha n=1 Tax=Sphingobium algorifonticola TaxID=2008318 RepID=A0A437J3L4_9SPHN|nr:aromatic ring-hydroxylating dioxygenase subunit alpha [Sphingobium algorifonticola]RVT39145.1 aromatic ring-hydroxylating dioxygenase subunit alpha [Sphingobium algorifonticola]